MKTRPMEPDLGPVVGQLKPQPMVYRPIPDIEKPSAASRCLDWLPILAMVAVAASSLAIMVAILSR
ncbi:MAG TPA: hypothetical protein VNQ50_03700 [Xanthobacteraceae bacterium]|nr:hypothetical protein [Xanthobacteraceae bacterium]